ncbi:chalcone isomerase [Tanacetum coccineum]|uniref:Chalcone isomerase n=1 Tax=Tanacetum coccineum TaxID=301880 RepID=A0ABQ4YJ80_9ASTR
MKAIVDAKRTDREFAVGQWVYLKLQPHRKVFVRMGKYNKLNQKYYGPFQVVQRVGQVAYKLELLSTSQIHPVFHVSQLKKYKGLVPNASAQLPICNAEGEIVSVPVKVLDRNWEDGGRHLGSEMVTVDDISFPSQITTSKPLSLLGNGITDIEIHFLQIKFTAIGRCRNRLAADDKYEEEEEEALEKIVEFFQTKYFKKDSVLTFSFPAASNTAEIGFSSDEKEEPKTMKVENGNVVEMIKKWYLGGTSAYSPSTIASLASTLSLELSK